MNKKLEDFVSHMKCCLPDNPDLLEDLTDYMEGLLNVYFWAETDRRYNRLPKLLAAALEEEDVTLALADFIEEWE